MTNETIELYQTRLTATKERLIKTTEKLSQAIEGGDYEKAEGYNSLISHFNSRITAYLKIISEEIESEKLKIKNDDSLNTIQDKIENQRKTTLETVIAIVKYGEKSVDDLMEENQKYIELMAKDNSLSGDYNVWVEAHSKSKNSSWYGVGYDRLISIDLEKCKIKETKLAVYLQNDEKGERYVLEYK